MQSLIPFLVHCLKYRNWLITSAHWIKNPSLSEHCVERFEFLKYLLRGPVTFNIIGCEQIFILVFNKFSCLYITESIICSFVGTYARLLCYIY